MQFTDEHGNLDVPAIIFRNGRYELFDNDLQAQAEQRVQNSTARQGERSAGKEGLLRHRRTELRRLLHPAASSTCISRTRSTLEADAARITSQPHRVLAEVRWWLLPY